MDNNDIICKIYVKGAKNQKEKKKAEDIGMKAYKESVKLLNKIVIPLYNRIFDKLFPNYTKEDRLDEDKSYTKLFLKISNLIGKVYLLFFGGYWFSEKKKVCLNYNFTFRPCTDEEIKKYPRSTHIVEDMISIKRFGE